MTPIGALLLFTLLLPSFKTYGPSVVAGVVVVPTSDATQPIASTHRVRLPPTRTQPAASQEFESPMQANGVNGKERQAEAASDTTERPNDSFRLIRNKKWSTFVSYMAMILVFFLIFFCRLWDLVEGLFYCLCCCQCPWLWQCLCRSRPESTMPSTSSPMSTSMECAESMPPLDDDSDDDDTVFPLPAHQMTTPIDTGSLDGTEHMD